MTYQKQFFRFYVIIRWFCFPSRMKFKLKIITKTCYLGGNWVSNIKCWDLKRKGKRKKTSQVTHYPQCIKELDFLVLSKSSWPVDQNFNKEKQSVWEQSAFPPLFLAWLDHRLNPSLKLRCFHCFIPWCEVISCFRCFWINSSTGWTQHGLQLWSKPQTELL